MDKKTIVLKGKSQREFAHLLIDSAPADYRVEIREPKRSDEQNDKMWAMLADLSAQVLWDGERLQDFEWKDFLTAILRKSRMVRAPDGGLVIVGASTSRMSVRQMNELIELMYAFGAEQGVEWSEPNPYERKSA